MTAAAQDGSGAPAIAMLAQDAFSRPSGIARYQSELILGMAPRIHLHLLVPGRDAYSHGKGLPPAAQSARVRTYGTGREVFRNLGRIVARLPGNGDLLTWHRRVCLNNVSSRLFSGTFVDREAYPLVHGTAGFLPDTRGKTVRVVTIHDTTPIAMPKHHTRLTTGLFIRPRELRPEDFVVVGTQSALTEFRAIFKHPEERTRVISYGFDQAKFQPAADGARGEIGSSYILSVGAIEPRKNLVSMLAAFEKLIAAHADLLWKIVGQKAWGWAEFAAALERSPARGRVDLLGALPEDELLALYQRAAALVYPSIWEGFGYPVVEALSCGTPVAASDIPSVREAGGSGFVPLDPKRIDSIVEAVERAAFDTTGRESRRRAGIDHVRRFSWPRAVNEHLALYAEALGVPLDALERHA